MASILLNLVADFDTQLSTAASIGGTTATLVSATDDDGNALPTGTYGLTIDAGNSSKEYIICTLTGTSLTSILSITRQGVTSSGFARSHRRGAKVTVTDWAILSRMLKLLNGTGAFDSTAPINYDAHPTFTTDYQIVDKKYVDDIVIGGGTDASSTIKGISKLSINPVSPTNPIAVGDNDTRVPTQAENDALAGNNTDIAVGTGNKYVTQTGLIHNAEIFAVDGSASSTAYTATLSQVPTSLTDGMVVRVKIGLANTTTTPTLNVNSLGAKTIVKTGGTALATSDIAAGMYCTFIYDLTNTRWIMLNPVAIAPLTAVDINIQQQVIHVRQGGTSNITYATTSYLGASTSNPIFIVSNEGGTNSPQLNRYIKLSNGSLVMSHTVVTSLQVGSYSTVCVIGSYVYVFGSLGGSPKLYRYDIANLANETAMTISGTAMTSGTAIFSDGTDLYQMYTNGTAQIYTISGTTATSGSTVNYTSSVTNSGYWSDGTYLYGIDAGSGSGGCYKWAIAGGARTTGTTLFMEQYNISGTQQTTGGGIFKEVGNTSQILTIFVNKTTNPVGTIIPITIF